jgi:RHS repeat-associated protein
MASYEAYGKRTADYSPTGINPAVNQDPAGFGGQFGYYTDRETSLLCLTHRYYDPGTGRFVNRDPIGYNGGVNLYGFAGGNPVNESDPDGTQADGHHYVNQAFYKAAGFSPTVYKFFADAKTGPVPGGHNYTGHGVYNSAVAKLWSEWSAARKITPTTTTVANAQEFLDAVKASKDPAIRNVLDNLVAKRFAEQAVKDADQMAARKAMEVVGKKAGKKILRTAFKRLPIIGLIFFISDYRAYGFGQATMNMLPIEDSSHMKFTVSSYMTEHKYKL